MTDTEAMPAAMHSHKLMHADIHPDADNVRADDRSEIESLAQSILINGLVQPITLRRDNTIIAGHRRHAALGLLIERGAISRHYPIPVHYYDGADQQGSSVQLMLVENLQRVDLDPVEEARGYQRLIDDYGLKHAEIGDRIGKSSSLVSGRIRLLKLPDFAQTMLQSGEINLEVAEALIPLAAHPDLIRECLTMRLSVAAIETRVAKLKQQEKRDQVVRYITDAGHIAFADRLELAEAGYLVNHAAVSMTFSTKQQLVDTLGAFDGMQVFFVTINYQDEVLIHPCNLKPELTAGPDGAPVDDEAEARKQAERDRKQAIAVRRASLMEYIGSTATAKSVLEPMYDELLLHVMSDPDLKFVCGLLGVTKEQVPEHSWSTETQRGYNWKSGVRQALAHGGKQAQRTRTALIVGYHELRTQLEPSAEYSGILAELFEISVNDQGHIEAIIDRVDA